MAEAWQVLERVTPVDNEWITVRQDRCRTPDGVVLDDYFTVIKPDYVQIVATTGNDELLLVRQYKHGSQAAVTELPAGYVDAGEDPATAARRELLEETGFDARTTRSLGTLFTSPAVLTNRAHVFLCDDLEDTRRQRLDPGEQIEVLRVPVREAIAGAREGLLDDVSSVAALFLALPHLESRP